MGYSAELKLTWTHGQEDSEEEHKKLEEDDEPNKGKLDPRASSIRCLSTAKKITKRTKSGSTHNNLQRCH